MKQSETDGYYTELVPLALTRAEWAVVLDLAINGYNAEIKYKTARPKDEHPSARAMRRSEEKELIHRIRRAKNREPEPTTR